MLSEPVCDYHIVVLGSNPIHTFFRLYGQTLYYICHCVEKRTKINIKGAGFCPFKHGTKIVKRIKRQKNCCELNLFSAEMYRDSTKKDSDIFKFC